MIAVRKLDAASVAMDDQDPILAALLAAPLATELESAEERAADLAAIAEYQAGRALIHSAAEVHADIEAMHRPAAE